MILDSFRLAMVQFNPRPGAVRHNAGRILAFVEQAAALGADLCVFPEAALTGYCIADLHADPGFLKLSRDTLETWLAPRIHGCACVVGYLDSDGQAEGPAGRRSRNSWALISDGRIVAKGHKTLMADEGVLDDSRYYIPNSVDGLTPVELELRGRRVRLGVLVCQDVWDDAAAVHPAAILKDRGAELLVVINSSPFYVGKSARRLAVCRRRVQETGLPLVYVNTSGVQDNGKNIIIFDGNSFVLNADGALLHRAAAFSEELSLPGGRSFHLAEAPGQDAETLDALLFGIRDYFEKSAVFKGALIGVSGGIDSAVSAALCALSLGPERVLSVNMPSRFNAVLTRELAAELAGRLGVRQLVYPIQEQVDLKARVHAGVLGNLPSSPTMENVQARERGNILMTLSQEYSYMVVGNGNKTEFQRGYATLYGDLIGAIMPLGDLQKLRVYSLGRELNRRLGPLIPEGCFSVRASAELSEAQDVNRGLGDPFDYFVEGPLGVELVERGKSPSGLAAEFAARALDRELWVLDSEGKEIYDKFDAEAFREAAAQTRAAIRRSAFKRVQAPPIFVLSPRAFGFDFREAVLLENESF